MHVFTYIRNILDDMDPCFLPVGRDVCRFILKVFL